MANAAAEAAGGATGGADGKGKEAEGEPAPVVDNTPKFLAFAGGGSRLDGKSGGVRQDAV